MQKFKVFVTRKVMPEGIDLLKKEGFQIRMYDGKSPITVEGLYEGAKWADAIMPMLTEKIDKKFLNANKHLKCIANYAVGFNNIDLDEATKLGIPCSNTPEVLSNATADIAFALLISTARRVPSSMLSIGRGEWTSFDPLGFIGQPLVNKTIGIVGMGRIGFQLAKRCHKGWDMKVLYFDYFGKNKLADEQLNATLVNLDELLAQSDFVSMHVPLTPQTKEMANKEFFSKMKPTSIFINTSRGDTHNEKDLYEAIVNKKIWGAGLDVTNPEPMSKDSPLLKMDNVVITPHIASADIQSRNGMSRVAAQNIVACYKGQQLPTCINKEIYTAKPKL